MKRENLFHEEKVSWISSNRCRCSLCEPLVFAICSFRFLIASACRASSLLEYALADQILHNRSSLCFRYAVALAWTSRRCDATVRSTSSSSDAARQRWSSSALSFAALRSPLTCASSAFKASSSCFCAAAV